MRHQAYYLNVFLLTVLIIALAPPAEAQRRGRGQAPPDPSDTGLNLALIATPTASYVSGDTKVTNINDNRVPLGRRGRPVPDQAYGNWGSRRNTNWVEYEWPQAISTNKINVVWWVDGRDIHLPTACRLKYWDGTEFVDVKNVHGFTDDPNDKGLGLEDNKYNTTVFDEVTTTKLRLEFDPEGSFSTGILEWKVYDSGKSPKFPPKIDAGIDRVVVQGGKTYLNAKLQSLGTGTDNATKLLWSKETGPGTVSFADPTNPETTATFSDLGHYVLKLTATEGDLSSSGMVNVKVDAPPPPKPLGVVYTKRYKIDSPLWNARAKSLIVGWIPHCIDEINNTSLSQGGIDNFIEAGKALKGEPHAFHKGYPFSNAWVHQTVESMCIALMVDPQGDQEIIDAQTKMRATLDEWIPIILAAQEPDGYLQTRFTLGKRGEQLPLEHWSPRTRGEHEGYVAGYFIESAINHYTLTNGTDLRLYNAAKKLADCWVANIGPEPGKKEWFDGHQEMEQALVRFGRFVNDMEGSGHGDNYIKLAKFLLDCRKNGSEYDQSHLPVQQQYEAVGHAVRAVYTYSGMADVATETGDPDYRSAVKSLWDNIVNKKYYVTGGVGSGDTSEGFGVNYALKNNAYCESCSSCGEIFFQYKMNLSYHDAKYVDLYEETLYNALLGSTDIEGENFCYTNPLVGGNNRTPWHTCPCCVGNIPRTLLMIPTWTYVTDDQGVYVNLFIGSTIKLERVMGMDIEMVQKTDYPWSGNVSIIVNPAQSKEFSVRVRAPNRSVSELYTSTPEVNGITSIAVNGAPVPLNIVNGYAVITRRWTAGDKIDVVLPMVPQRVKAATEVAADRGLVALRFGPLMYNVESADGNNMSGVLNENVPLTTEWRPDLLQGVVVIKGKFMDGSDMIAVPNYVRNNRQASNRRGSGAGAANDAGAAGVGENAGAGQANAGQRRGRGGRGGGESVVWIRDEAE